MRIPGISVPGYVLSKKLILNKVYSTSILFHKLILRKTIATGNLQVYSGFLYITLLLLNKSEWKKKSQFRFHPSKSYPRD